MSRAEDEVSGNVSSVRTDRDELLSCSEEEGCR